MTNQLYPLKFNPIVATKLWGGSKLHTILNKPNIPKAGESWELSGVEGHLSVVTEGHLSGKTIKELIQEYKEDIVGKSIYKQFGDEFPLLIKFIDASDDLSVQVHPDDVLAKQKHSSKGKTEMWYVVDADEGAKLNCGFNQSIDRELVDEHIQKGKLLDILNFVTVEKGDVFFIPAGTVHAIGKGMLIAEIQQTSDITYRLFDFERKDSTGQYRELHLEDSLDAIDYGNSCSEKVVLATEQSGFTELVKCNYFTTNVIYLEANINKDLSAFDSFVIYMCVEGSAEVLADNKEYSLNKGETILIPASSTSLTLSSLKEKTTVLEVYVDVDL